MGIIPARAGFTRRPCTSQRGPWDHPRSRGVYFGTSDTFKGTFGSSPLARGLLAPNTTQLTVSRIIPARAGFTDESIARLDELTDHPRSRGVYWNDSDLCPLGGGSSPLARGLQAYFQAARNVGRIIPARAGFTTHHPSRKHTIPDHPRSRGVYESKTIKPRRHAGSSPLARGLPVDDNTLRRAFRIIPARAGFTKDKALRGAQNRDHPRSRGVYTCGSLESQR